MSQAAGGLVVWLTGLSGAGKSTLAAPLAARLREAGRRVEILDGDEVRTHLSAGLGFTREDRDTNVRRIGYVAELLARNGLVAITAAISPYREVRDEIRLKIERHGAGFLEVHVDCPLEVLAARDVKGLYRRALAGEVPQFTGVSDPYEAPLRPEVTVRSDREPLAESLEKIWAALAARGLVPSAQAA